MLKHNEIAQLCHPLQLYLRYICRYRNVRHAIVILFFYLKGKIDFLFAWLIIEIIHFYNFLSMPCTYSTEIVR